jgi:DOPA 4,5-dioxygenase
MTAPCEILGYHAHVYFGPETTAPAAAIRREVAAAFPVSLNNWNDRLVGPHPCWSYEISFPAALLGAIVPWLMQNRRGLTIFLHPLTGDDLRDHTRFAMWIGPSRALHLEGLD